jgi:hypothetical protein
MPGTARPRDRPHANVDAASANTQRMQASEQRAEVAEAARRADRVPPLLAGNRVGPLGDQDGAPVQVGDRFVRRAPLGRELVRRQVAQDRRVTRHRFGAPAGGE